MLACEHFGSAEDYTVYNDEREISAERREQVGQVCVHQHLDNRNEPRNYDDVGGNAHLIGNNLAERGDRHVGADENYCRRNTHAERTGYRVGDGEGRAGSENQHEYRV